MISDIDNSKIRIRKSDADLLVDGDHIEMIPVRHSRHPAIKYQVKVLERRRDPILGYYLHNNGNGMIVPLDPRTSSEIYIPKLNISDSSESLDGQVVTVIVNPPQKNSRKLTGTIIGVLGERHAPGVQSQIIATKYRIHTCSSKTSQLEALEVPIQEIPDESSFREDLRNLITITVDPPDAKDFDDALSLETTPEGYLLGVHIADVSYYVREGSAIDHEAYIRGTTVYFPDRAFHMLPDRLATDICSLTPDQDRLAMTVWITCDKEGQIISGKCTPSIIRSRCRLTYDQFLRASKGEVIPDIPMDVQALCRSLAELCQLFLLLRVKRGVLDLDMPEPYFMFDSRGTIINILKKQRSIAEQTIEEFMIAANVVVAGFLDESRTPYLRRVHEPPDYGEINDLKSALAGLGLAPPNNPLDPTEVREFLKQIDSGPVRSIASYQILRAMRRATYSGVKRGHFGLALSTYTQFTSPIRRYPDLEVHRSVKAALGVPGYHPQNASALEERGKWLSERERLAQEAEWEAIKIQKIRFMADKIGYTFPATITHVEKFGAFIEIDEPFIDGLIPAHRLKNYFRFDPVRQALISPDRKVILAPGVVVRVKAVLADMDRSIMDFTLADPY